MANSVIIGQGTMPVQCCNILLKHTQRVVAVCSPDDPLQRCAEQIGIPHFSKLNDLALLMEKCPVDYLFSIINPLILPVGLLRLPRRLSINYHDALLPRYAGSHATTWALINEELMHGVTWHIMTEKVDSGDILKQSSFRISQGDTAYRLNMKCYYAGIELFSDLVRALDGHDLRRTTQNLDERTYYSACRRPENNCLISFEWTAKRIDAFVRALDFERTANPVGNPKVIIRGRLLAVPHVTNSRIRSTSKPGTVETLGDSIRVATSTDDVFLRTVQTLGGRLLSTSELRGFGLSLGDCIQATNLSAIVHPEQG